MLIWMCFSTSRNDTVSLYLKVPCLAKSEFAALTLIASKFAPVVMSPSTYRYMRHQQVGCSSSWPQAATNRNNVCPVVNVLLRSMLTVGKERRKIWKIIYFSESKTQVWRKRYRFYTCHRLCVTIYTGILRWGLNSKSVVLTDMLFHSRNLQRVFLVKNSEISSTIIVAATSWMYSAYSWTEPVSRRKTSVQWLLLLGFVFSNPMQGRWSELLSRSEGLASHVSRSSCQGWMPRRRRSRGRALWEWSAQWRSEVHCTGKERSSNSSANRMCRLLHLKQIINTYLFTVTYLFDK